MVIENPNDAEKIMVMFMFIIKIEKKINLEPNRFQKLLIFILI